ncbi:MULTISPECIES: VanW family protein [Mediterraneibacter]|jgi:vancomycin resistance protein YoaR|uniref:VanW family protein n=1 Tax=Mediterraneibacter TaxID=2316020 RepID=UPI000E50B565|nr:VanW family protein [Mediterraneibacter massiliensis]RGT75082.1 vanomycin resistance protein VanB [Ruminococcus sp. AF18-22]
MDKQKRKRRKGRRYTSGKRTMAGLILLLVCAVCVIAAVQFFLHRTIDQYDKNIMIQGISVGITDVSGMTKEEAKAAVLADTESIGQEKMTLVLENGDQAETTLTELGLTVKSLDNVLKQAADYGKVGNAVNCYKILRNAEKGKVKKNFPVQYKVTEKTAAPVLEECLDPLLNLPVNAYVTQDESGVVIVEEQPGETLDIKKTVKNIEQFLGKKWNRKGGEVQAEVSHIEPEMTKEDLSEITDLLGSFTTYYGNDGSGRALNVESGADHLNGTLLKPEEEISVNGVMEPYTEENGYYPAASYEGDRVVESMGGGICQVSTTLYNAVLRAELEVTERHPHSMLVSYVEPSMDAAIAEDILDLKFKNSYKTPVYIEAYYADGALTFHIYGKETRAENRTVEYVSETLETEEAEGKYFVATEDPIGYIATQSEAHTGKTAQLWKIVYVDGQEVSKEIINYSQYLPSQETVGVGTASDNAEYTAKISAAVESQDEAKIQKAIQEITGGSS